VAVGRLPYRISQGLRTLFAPLTPLDVAQREAALTTLPEPAAAAFRTLPKADQRHALRVYHLLVASGNTDADLLTAALLHDNGKYPGVGITQRTIRVLLGRFPRALVGMARNSRFLARWRRGMAVLLNHADIGANRAAMWGCTPTTVALIRASHDVDAPEIVRRLQMVDNAS
jgi:hypothetical protein